MLDDLYGRIPADYYWRDDVLPREIDRVFRQSWLCVGFTDDLKNDRDFVTTEIGPHAIVVQNFKGQLKAFRNVCSHRFSRIQTERCGNRPLTCPYHGWTYDAGGKPFGVPHNAQAFGLDDDDRTALALSAYRLELCGRFVFICMETDTPSLREFLGGVYDDLEHFTAVCPHRISSTTLEWDVNWKVGLENAAEGYHTRMVHGDSLDATLDEDLRVDFIAEHSVFYRSLSEKTQAWWDRMAGIIKLKASARFPDSTNYVIFPNIVILATYGASFVFQTFEPLATRRFRFRSDYWIADARPGPAQQMFADNLSGFSATVMAEDHDICRNVQDGVRDVASRRAPLLGEPEKRIAHFQKAYARRMGALT